MNNSGPRMEPCSTPNDTSLDFAFTFTNCVLSCKNTAIMLKVVPLNP